VLRFPGSEEISRIRDAIAASGAFTITAKEFSALFAASAGEDAFRFLVELGLQEKWAFAFLPDGQVELKPLEADAQALSS